MCRCFCLSVLSTLVLSTGLAATAQSSQHNRITAPIDDANRVVLSGNVRPEVKAENDRGALPDSTPINGLQLVLQRSPAAQAAFDAYLAGLNDPHSSNYHQWLSNAQIGTMFGPSSEDITKISHWLTNKGFTVHGVSPDGMVIEFDGTAGTVRTSLHAPIHNLSVEGAQHFANVKDPEVPAAMASVVGGVASINNFMPHPLSQRRTTTTAANVVSAGVAGTDFAFLSAADIAKIYNFTPTFASGITGKGQTIVLIEDTNQYNLQDWQIFRKVFGLSPKYPYATLTQVNPSGTNTCTSPGVNGDDAEAAIDIDWATAAAPNAAIISAACKDTAQFGGFLALANILQEANPPKIVSISYGEAEASLGAAENLYINNLYATAVAEGVSVYVSSGDEGAASADANRTTATHGIGVSGFMSTPNDISVGGTDFGNIPLSGASSYSTYFSSTNGPYFETALSYIPEIPWDDSCAGGVLSAYYGYPQYGTGSICNATTSFHTTAAGSGGPSGCATGAATVSGVVSGTCAGYPKPSWQSVFGNPGDGVRDTPDVSLFAANGFWEAYYAVCISDPTVSSGACSTQPSTWAGFGGTSISSPIWAGIQALVNQKTGTNWGNSNPVLYTLANAQYGGSGSPSCNSSLGNGVSASCVFYDVTYGDIVVNCSTNRAAGGFVNCYNTGGTYGALSVSNTSFVPAYPATPGWDFATGIGTTNVTNLVNSWP